MLRLASLSHPPIQSPLNSISSSRSQSISAQYAHVNFCSSLLKTQTQIAQKPIRFIALAGNSNGLNQNGEEKKEKEQGGVGSGGDDEVGKNQSQNEGSIFSNIRWGDLLLDPDPNNILAVGLTGLLTWASVQVLWQLLFISLAILVAAVKYSFIAAILLFILIALL